MARWTILLFVYSVVNGREMNLYVLKNCCKAGRLLALSGQNCTPDHPISSSDQCGFTKEKCCLAAEIDQFCEDGMEKAKEHGVCDELSFPGDPPQGVLSKLCCDCCKFGLTQAPTCGFHGLLMGDLCLDSAKACCVKNTKALKQTTHDVDVCLSGDHICNSDQICINTLGSYICQTECATGFEVNSNNICQDIDECAQHNGGHQCSYSCANVPGSFHCTCPSTGYTLAPNERTCQDIDECALGTHTCSFHGSCFNILGGFRCLSLACPQYFQLAGHGKDTSASWNCYKACHPQDVQCRDYTIDLIRYISLSLATFQEISEPKEILFLQSNVAASYPHVYGETDVSFKMLVADDQSSFDVIKRSHGGMFVGVVHQVKPIRGPRDLVLQVAMDYVKSGTVSYHSIAVIHVFISESLS